MVPWRLTENVHKSRIGYAGAVYVLKFVARFLLSGSVLPIPLFAVLPFSSYILLRDLVLFWVGFIFISLCFFAGAMIWLLALCVTRETQRID